VTCRAVCPSRSCSSREWRHGPAVTTIPHRNRTLIFQLSSYCKIHCKILPECTLNTPKTVQDHLGKFMKTGSGRGFRSIMRPSLQLRPIRKSHRLCGKNNKYYSSKAREVKLLRDAFMLTVNTGSAFVAPDNCQSPYRAGK
jgi:hypothetical protein